MTKSQKALAHKFRQNQFTFKGIKAIKDRAVTTEWGFPLTYKWQ